MPTPPPAPGLNPAAAFAAFHRLVIDDAELFAQLQNFASTEDFAARAVELGAARGLKFSSDDVLETLQIVRHAWLERSLA